VLFPLVVFFVRRSLTLLDSALTGEIPLTGMIPNSTSGSQMQVSMLFFSSCLSVVVVGCLT